MLKLLIFLIIFETSLVNGSKENIVHETNITKVNALTVSWNEFLQSVISNDYDYPTRRQHITFQQKLLSGGIESRRETAMFLAQIIWESGGLAYTREMACAESGCPGVHDTSDGLPGRSYYGRGYIQLSHSYNYRAASLDLYGDLRLMERPDLVADDEDAAWATAFWYWKVRVHPRVGVRQGWFGDSTKAINGLECMGGGWDVRPKKRFAIYKNVLIALGVKDEPVEKGCYN